MKKIITSDTIFAFLQHANVARNGPDINLDLTEVGWQQSCNVGQKMKSRQIFFDLALISPTRQTQQTAAGIIGPDHRTQYIKMVELFTTGGPDGEILTNLMAKLKHGSLVDYYALGGRDVLGRFGSNFLKRFENEDLIRNTLNDLEPAFLLVGHAGLIQAVATRFCVEYGPENSEAALYCRQVKLGECDALVVKIDKNGHAELEHIQPDPIN